MLSIAGVPVREVAEVGDGLEAIEILRQRPFDLVLCDLHMPRMGGIAVLAAIRHDPALHSPVFVVVSSDHSEDRRARLLQAGAAAFIQKPLSPDKLRTVLGEIIPSLWSQT